MTLIINRKKKVMIKKLKNHYWLLCSYYGKSTKYCTYLIKNNNYYNIITEQMVMNLWAVRYKYIDIVYI
jgi:hypothetical protein